MYPLLRLLIVLLLVHTSCLEPAVEGWEAPPDILDVATAETLVDGRAPVDVVVTDAAPRGDAVVLMDAAPGRDASPRRIDAADEVVAVDAADAVDAEEASVLDAADTADCSDCLAPECDSDGIPDSLDNCPCTFNPDQSDFDADGAGDVCDVDDDGDGDPDVSDCGPLDPEVGHGQPEICDDGVDNDCDGEVDTPDCCPPGAQGCVSDAECNSATAGFDDACVTAVCDACGSCILEFADGQPCNDEDACKEPGVCVSGSCTGGGGPIVCDDGEQCTAANCDPVTGCFFEPLPDGWPCDGVKFDNCPWSGECIQGVCDLNGPNLYSCNTASDCDPSWSGFDSECILPECPMCQCTFTVINEGGACDDGDACTQNTSCAAGECLGVPVDCDDGNPCTTDGCDHVTGCTNTPIPGCT